jgi:hypothetical protein
MKLRILSVHNGGDYDNEYVMLEAVENCNIGFYMLADSTYVNPLQVSDKLRHIYWMPHQKVESGERVSVWTKPGTNTIKINDAGVVIHRLFWGLNTAVWNDEGDCAVLFQLREWKFFEID